MKITVSLLFIVSVGFVTSSPTNYRLKLQPELDNLDVSGYLKNERLMKLQYVCIMFDGPCDVVGRWTKPRAPGLLLGRCDMCTETQQKWVSEWYEVLVNKYPDIYRAGIAKYILSEGIDIGKEEKDKIKETFKEDDEAVIDKELELKSNSELQSDTIVETTSSTISVTMTTFDTFDETTATENYESVTARAKIHPTGTRSETCK